MSSCCITFFSMYAITFYYTPALTSCLSPQISNTLSNLMLKSAKSDPSLFFSCFQPASFVICHSFHHFSSTFSTAKSQAPPPNLHLTPSYSHLETHAHHLCQKSAQATTRGQAPHDEIDHGGFDTFLGRFWVQPFQRDYGSHTSLEFWIYIYK